MKLGPLARLYASSPFRQRLQRPWEFLQFEAIAPFTNYAHILEIGCGNGTGLAYVADHYSPISLSGVDSDAKQIARARTSLASHRVATNLVVAHAERIPLPAQSYDVIISSDCLAHITNWPLCIAEARRLLHAGGLFYIWEFYHAGFTHENLVTELNRHGFEILGTYPQGTTQLSRWLGSLGRITVARMNMATQSYD